MAKEFLSRRGVPYMERDVSRDPTALADMQRCSGQMGVPVITVGNEVIVGFNAPRLEQALKNANGRKAVARPPLGALVKDAPSAGPAGAYVGGIRPGSLAERAALRAGDIIVAVGPHPVHGTHDLAAALDTLAAQYRYTSLFVLRDGQRIELPLDFGSRPP
jgi:glutaredoxin 3